MPGPTGKLETYIIAARERLNSAASRSFSSVRAGRISMGLNLWMCPASATNRSG
jgi:hypothetical protein